MRRLHKSRARMPQPWTTALTGLAISPYPLLELFKYWRAAAHGDRSGAHTAHVRRGRLSAAGGRLLGARSRAASDILAIRSQRPTEPSMNLRAPWRETPAWIAAGGGVRRSSDRAIAGARPHGATVRASKTCRDVLKSLSL
ncbi:MAG: hypothetical protein BGP06_00420 [Rhizobiales bacterium 65-9]|nr:MAG: hypothetical protein BGP06_00420 [Rhizobiales bacterium 65-9]